MSGGGVGGGVGGDELDLDLEGGLGPGQGEEEEEEEWTWERLRKEARRLETALQAALGDYGRLGTEVGALRRAGPAAPGRDAQARALGEVTETRARVDAAEERLEGLMVSLDEVNDSLSRALPQGGDGGAYAAQRYVAILRDARAEYRRTRSALQNNLVQAELMVGRSAGGAGGVSSRAELLLKEKGAIHSSRAAAAEILDSALGSREALVHQRGVFSTIGGKLSTVGDKFPQVNELITKISRHKNRDNIVLAGVIASCMFFTFFYSVTRA